MKKKLLQMWYKLTCNHEFWQDKQITIIKCRKCGYTNWLLNGNSCNLYPYDKAYGVEGELQSKESFK